MKNLFFLLLMLCFVSENIAQDLPADQKHQSANKSKRDQIQEVQPDSKSQPSDKSVKKQKRYTVVLPLNKNESRMLLAGILTYSITYPDSVEADLMINLLVIQKFIDSKDTLSGYFENVPIEAISYVEQKYFGREGIMGYSPTEDNRQFENMERMIEMNLQQLEQNKERLKIARQVTRDKISFQCKYYTANGYPCPADTPKLEVTPVKNDEN